MAKREAGQSTPEVDKLVKVADELGGTIACRGAAVWGMIGYVMLPFAFSRASERVGKRRVLASRVVVAIVVLAVMTGFVGMAGTFG